MSDYKTLLIEFSQLRRLEITGQVVVQEWERLQAHYGAVIDRGTIDLYLEDQDGRRTDR